MSKSVSVDGELASTDALPSLPGRPIVAKRSSIPNKVNTLREFAFAVHAFDCSLRECSDAVLGRPITAGELFTLLELLRAKNPREVSEADLYDFILEINK